MIERFREPDRAVAYLCAALRKDFEDAQAICSWYPKDVVHPRERIVDAQHVIPTLEYFCSHFVEAIAIHGLEYRGYPIGGVQCQCHPKMHHLCPYRCRDFYDKPIVTVIVTRDRFRPTESDKLDVLHLLQEHVEHERKHADDRIGRHGSGASIRRRD